MSLFNMVMGRNPYGPYLMGVLGFVQGSPQVAWLGRFRDVYTNDDADRIFILHRNYPDDNEYNQAIKQHPNFIRYTPDQDCTYGVWEFSVPPQHHQMVKEISSLSDNTPVMDRYRKLIKDMSNGVDNEATRNAVEAGKKILQPVVDVMEGKGTKEQEVKHGDGSVVVYSFEK